VPACQHKHVTSACDIPQLKGAQTPFQPSTGEAKDIVVRSELAYGASEALPPNPRHVGFAVHAEGSVAEPEAPWSPCWHHAGVHAAAGHLRRCLFHSRMPEAVPCPNGPKCPLTCECVDILPACLTLVLSPSWLTGYHHTAEGAIGLGPPVMLYIHSFIHGAALRRPASQAWVGPSARARLGNLFAVYEDIHGSASAPVSLQS